MVNIKETFASQGRNECIKSIHTNKQAKTQINKLSYQKFSIGGQKSRPIGLHCSVLLAEAKLHCKPVQLCVKFRKN